MRSFQRLLRGIRADVVLEDIGAYLVQSIKRRTQERHEDIDGRAFKAYSSGHAFFRQQVGYGQEVDLTLTGSMFASLTHTVFADRVKIFFMPGSDKSGMSNPAKAFYLQDDRQFFGYTDDDVDRIMHLYSVNIGEAFHGR